MTPWPQQIWSLVIAFTIPLISAPAFAKPKTKAKHVTTEIDPAAAIKAAVEAPDRSGADRELDVGRQPAATLAFFKIAPGQKVAEIAAAGGYTTELLERTVGPKGLVYGQNSPAILAKFAQKPWSDRLAKPVNQQVKRIDSEFDQPFPPEVKDLDAVLNILFYHDMVWLKVDRDKMNAAIFAALKPGGIYGIIDHQAKAGQGLQDAQTLHRIDMKTLRDEVEKAGFKLAAEGDFLRNPKDDRS